MADELDLEFKTEAAVIAWIADVATHGVTLGITARHAEEDGTDEATLPAIVVKAERDTEYPISSGCYRMNLTATYKANAADTTDAVLTATWSKLVEVLMWDALAARLSDLAEFHCYGVQDRGPTTKEPIAEHWERSFTVVAHCMAMDG